MTLTSALYWTDILGNVGEISNVIIILGIAFFCVLSIIYIALMDDKYEIKKLELFKRILKKWWVLILCFVMYAATPSRTTMYLMLGTTYLEQSNLPSKVSETLELKLDEYIKQLKEAK